MFCWTVSINRFGWVRITIAQWWRYQACELHFMSLNLPWAFVHIYWLKIFENQFFIQNCIFFHQFDLYISFASVYLYNNQVNFLLILETISQDVMSHLKLKEASWQGGFQQCSDRNQPSNMKRVKNFKFQGWGVRVAGRGVYNARAYILTHMDEKKKSKILSICKLHTLYNKAFQTSDTEEAD